MKKGIVYLIKNNINGHRYIGITTMSLNRRWSCHVRDSKKSNYPLYKSMRKNGVENFTLQILKEIQYETKEKLIIELVKLEVEYIKLYKSYIKFNKKGYNLTPGGQFFSRTMESIKKQSITMKKKYRNDQKIRDMYRKKIKDAYKNTNLRNKLSKIQKKRYEDPMERKKTSDSIKEAYKNSKDLRNKLSIAHIEFNKNNPENRKLHSERMSGKNHPLFNKKIYIYKNIKTQEEFKGTSYDFRLKFNLNQGKVSLLVNRKKEIYNNWKIL